ncbi:hypothetical protein [Pseudoduganella violaceinigra]|uniref:hypothetical protein n=1 Tax=Pseudoduganella violaceinigra TaxID=246602 RepID=UPI000429FCBF|nr:hypothetical protein [Pseudoduganella violaceinigra]
MKELEPKFRCVGCKRGLLNRSVARCLYCGADVPEEARLAPEAIAQRDAVHARMEASRARLAQYVPPKQKEEGSPALDFVDGVATGLDVIDMLGGGLSLLGQVLD